MRVTDPSANNDFSRETVSATVTSDLAGDSEPLSLLETGPETGVFEGLIDLEPGGTLSAPTLATGTSAGQRDTVHASYDSATKELTFNLALHRSFSEQAPLDLGIELAEGLAGIETNAQASIAGTLDLELTLGADLDYDPTAGDNIADYDF